MSILGDRSKLVVERGRHTIERHGRKLPLTLADHHRPAITKLGDGAFNFDFCSLEMKNGLAGLRHQAYSPYSVAITTPSIGRWFARSS